MACVRVGSGEEAKEYTILAALFRKRSAFFDNALKPRWGEGEHRLMDLANDDPKFFTLYLHTLYGEALPLECSRLQTPQPTGKLWTTNSS